jgi:2-C-methyl-D-erythritol 4-phosphate cytidylyltransferase
MQEKMMPSRFAIILAGGSGTRMGIEIPKQFLLVASKPVIVHTLETFQTNNAIDHIIIVSHPDHIDQTGRLVAEYRITKVDKIIAGGETRQRSSYNALCSRTFGDDDILIFHDAVRPFISKEIIDECIRETESHGAAAVCVPTTDTIVQSDVHGFVAGLPDRNVLHNAQTPQAFTYRVIRDAHEKAIRSSFTHATDDVRLAVNAGHKVKIVMGSYENIKITNMNDMIIAETIAIHDTP